MVNFLDSRCENYLRFPFSTFSRVCIIIELLMAKSIERYHVLRKKRCKSLYIGWEITIRDYFHEDLLLKQNYYKYTPCMKLIITRRKSNMQPCLFNGLINGAPVKSFEGTVIHDEFPRYIILKLKIGDDFWMMDLTGITNTPGKHTYTLVLKKHDGTAFIEHYSCETTQQVFLNPKMPQIFGFFKSTIVVKDQKGSEIVVQGDFLWDTSRFSS